MRRTESLLKAAGLLDEESARNELVDGEADQPDSESEHDNGRNEDISETADWGVISDNQPRHHALTGQKLGSTTGNLDRSSCPPLGPKRSSTHHERRHSATGCSDLQHVPVLRADDREESRYYGLCRTYHILRCCRALTGHRTIFLHVHSIATRDRMDQRKDRRRQIPQLFDHRFE